MLFLREAVQSLGQDQKGKFGAVHHTFGQLTRERESLLLNGAVVRWIQCTVSHRPKNGMFSHRECPWGPYAASSDLEKDSPLTHVARDWNTSFEVSAVNAGVSSLGRRSCQGANRVFRCLAFSGLEVCFVLEMQQSLRNPEAPPTPRPKRGRNLSAASLV